MKGRNLLAFSFILLISLSFVSAGWFSDLFNPTGNSAAQITCDDGTYAMADGSCPSTTGASVPTTTNDLTPRISYWWGKVNQHTEDGVWMTDSDGISGASKDKLEYCKKFYPDTKEIKEYKLETINDWRDAYNKGSYSSEQMSYECVQKVITTECIESEFKDEFTKGVSYKYEYSDGIKVDSKTRIGADRCYTGTESNYLSEFYCNGTSPNQEIEQEKIYCENGCADGACIGDSVVNDIDDGFGGNPSATIYIQAYTDFEGPYDSKWYINTLPLIRENFKEDVFVAPRYFPLSFHKYSENASISVACLLEQTLVQDKEFRDYTKKLYFNQQNLKIVDLLDYGKKIFNNKIYDKFKSCLTGEDIDSYNIAKSNVDFQKKFAEDVRKIKGTPSFIITNRNTKEEYIINGAQSYSEFEKTISELLNNSYEINESKKSFCDSENVCTIYVNESLVIDGNTISLDSSNLYGNYAYLYLNGASYMNYIDTNNYNLISKNLSVILIKNNESSLGLSFKYKTIEPYVGTCSDAINSMNDISKENLGILPFFSGVSYYGLDDMAYIGQESGWINNKYENATFYSRWIGLDDNSGNNNNYYIKAYVFENKKINLGSYLENKIWGNICSLNNNEDKGQYYVCKNIYDIASEDSSRNSEKMILWYNNNVLFSIQSNSYSYDEDKNQEDLLAFANNLKDNSYSPTNLYLDYRDNEMKNSFIEACPSSINKTIDKNNPFWQCSLEPAVCPSHGYQTERCIDTNNPDSEVKERSISCNPGVCDGCMVPKWADSSSWGKTQRKCMPYGARWELTSVDKDESILYEGSENSSDESMNLVILDGNTAKLFYSENGKILIDKKLTVDEWTSFDTDYGTIEFVVEDIFYSAKDGTKSYISIKIKNIEKNNVYCSYQGTINTQKERWVGDSITSCQENFECESNTCSSGECVDVKGMIDDIRGFRPTLVKIMCKVSDIFGVQDYDSCVTEKLLAK